MIKHPLSPGDRVWALTPTCVEPFDVVITRPKPHRRRPGAWQYDAHTYHPDPDSTVMSLEVSDMFCFETREEAAQYLKEVGEAP